MIESMSLDVNGNVSTLPVKSISQKKKTDMVVAVYFFYKKRTGDYSAKSCV